MGEFKEVTQRYSTVQKVAVGFLFALIKPVDCLFIIVMLYVTEMVLVMQLNSGASSSSECASWRYVALVFVLWCPVLSSSSSLTALRTSKRTCLIFGVSIGLEMQKEFLIGQSSRSHATYRWPSLDSFYFPLARACSSELCSNQTHQFLTDGASQLTQNGCKTDASLCRPTDAVQQQDRQFVKVSILVVSHHWCISCLLYTSDAADE